MRNVEVPKWLQELPLAPEFRPTDTEFADPIAYITKIEKEASSYGICKIIPPVPKPSRKFVFHNLNKSLSKCPELGPDVTLDTSSMEGSNVRDNRDRKVNDGDIRAVFTTRSQELGTEKGKRLKGTAGDSLIGPKKQVWQSGEVYTLDQFEAKSRNFAKSQLGTVKEVNPLVIEAMFWKAASEKPIYVEYANDVPGSAFGEPEGLMQYFDRRRKRRRRKRNSFDRNSLVSADPESNQMDTLENNSDTKNSISQNNSSSCTVSAADAVPSNQPISEASFSGRKAIHCDSEMEGTSGWKLSNSPWNLQVIARSPGSLTRFMPDDIPGVTSPMVYIGMLFSWFAWHVEDHELHSLNFLHVGSPKTWYSVPGDHAYDFEEVIRLNVNGGSTNRFDALSLLGEKTTVISPEVILSSGIPCFRLVQNPGDFVVTFPRAYHIGFSHGFNCGEAANFGTPRWLDVAKEAAVRRAAMNYLPMLSHQQLLYLLTMSFISRVPRTLLPGVRSSRFKERLKEERELLVKKAFIEDILHENDHLRFLLRRNSSYRAVLWDAESLPSSGKGAEVCKNADTVSPVKECLQNADTVHELLELNDFMNAVGSDLCNDDLSYDFQVESGALPCVACGVLGFPFMAILQPYSMASASSLLPDFNAVPVESSLDGSHKDKSSTKDKPSVAAGISASVQSLLDTTPLAPDTSGLIHKDISSKPEISKEWNASDVFLKPRIFCLEHAIEVEELLSTKCRVNVLVLCHSDFQKIMIHASTVAEEGGIAFHFNEVPLDNASPADMNLIDISIDKGEQDCAENWTSFLNISLQHLVKVKKSSQHENNRYLMSVHRLLSGEISMPNASSVKWLSRKLRTKRHPQLGSQSKHSDDDETVIHMKASKRHPSPHKNAKIILYSRKKQRACNASSELVTNDVAKTTIRPDCKLKVGENSYSSHDDLHCHEAEFDDMECEQNSAKENKDLVPCGSPETSAETCSRSGSADSSSADSLVECAPEHSKESSDGNMQHIESFTEDFIPRDEPSTELNSPSDRSLSGSSNNMVEKKGSRKRREVDQLDACNFIRSPCEGLRPRAKELRESGTNSEPTEVKRARRDKDNSVSHKNKNSKNRKQRHRCDIEGCTMSFNTRAELLLHKDDRCPVSGCRKKFSSHKCAIQHHRVHDQDRPLHCPWKGCTMSFKWAWARTEHLRVHTGERPYVCKVEGCGLTFRFISDFSRHRRKTGHHGK